MTKTKKAKIDPEIKKLAKKAVKNVREQYKLPDFDLDRLLIHIDQLVKFAPGGVIQLVIDLFCGAGGTSEGIEQARYNGFKNSCIIAGINHDKKAIYSQAVNHPLAYYTDEDIRFANLTPLVKLVDQLRERYPQCPIILWGSMECTNHSNAKGGLSRDPDSRTLPWDMYRYIESINPDGIWIENVKEFAEWGPMMERVVLAKGKTKQSLKNPVPRHLEEAFYAEKIEKGFTAYCTLDIPGKKKKSQCCADSETCPKIGPEWVVIKDLKGTYYLPWKDKIDSYGYHNKERIINAADHGAPTNRHRLFLIFMRTGWPITFPHPTHSKKPKKGDLFDPGLKPHVPVKTCLDFSDEGRSVFEPGHVKSDNTWQRIYEGLIKFVAGGKNAYMVQRNGGNPLSRIYPVDGPARTVTSTGGNQELVQAFIMKYLSNNANTGSNAGSSIDEPASTITTQDRLGLIQLAFIDTIYGNGYSASLDNASPTVRTKDGMALVIPKFLLNYQGQSNANSIEETSPTLMTKEKLALMSVKHFLYRAYTSGGSAGSIDEPEGSQTTNPKTALMKVEGWLMDSHFKNIGSDLNDPANTVTANRKWSYLMNPSWFGSLSSVNDPSVTIVARQDKAPMYFLTASETHYALAIPVFHTDSEIVVKIKEFMALYDIYDIKKRMLLVPELLQIQSFPVNYYLAGSKTDQKKFIGNAVPPLVAKAIAESMYTPLVEHICKIRNIHLKLAA